MAKYEMSMLHQDDVKLGISYPEDLSRFTDLSEEEFTNTFEIFGRILFDNLLTKDRKDFEIMWIEEENKWAYIFKTQSK